MKGKVLAMFSVGMFVAASIGVTLAGCTPKESQPAFPERDITLVVPYSAGGGYDVYARAIASVMPKYLPRQVRVIVENREGGGGVKGFTYVYTSPPDGHTVGTTPLPGVVVSQLLGDVQYDIYKMNPICAYNAAPSVVVVKADSAINRLADLAAKEKIKYGSPGGTTSSHYSWMVTAAEMGIVDKLVTVTGYKSVTEALMSLLRGEVEISNGTPETVYDLVRKGELKVMTVMGDKRDPFYPNALTTVEQGYPQLDAALVNYRTVWAPPNTPDKVVQALEKAFLSSLQDPEVTAWAEKTAHPVSAVSAREVADARDKVGKIFGKYLHLLK